MSTSRLIKVNGGASIGPCSSSCSPFPGLGMTIPLNFEQTRNAHDGRGRSVNSPSSFIDLLEGTNIELCTLVVLRIASGSLILRYSTAAGDDQLLSCSRTWIYDSPTAGQEITALAIKGVAEIEFIVAGDQ